jgi:hypothetical protein
MGKRCHKKTQFSLAAKVRRSEVVGQTAEQAAMVEMMPLGFWHPLR